MTEDPTQTGAPQPAPRRLWPKAFLRVTAQVASLSLFLVLVWAAGSFLIHRMPASTPTPAEASISTATPQVDLASLHLPDLLPKIQLIGIPRQAMLHTILPSRPRFDVTTYTIKQGDTIFAIGEKYGLKVQSLMWGNYEILGDNPDMISPGVTLVILPVDGVYHKWREGEGLNGVAKGYHVTPEDIIDWPGNHLTRESVGDYSKPNIAPGTMLIVPGGTRDYISQVAAIPRKSPGVGSYLGPGSCGSVSGGAIGTGSFVWPVVGTITQGFLPDINHPALDIAAPLGTTNAAADTGVVVYAGPTYDKIGYGNLVIIDHGNGWQTLYAHNGPIYVTCGEGVFKGAAIGAIGMTGHTTGPHLHFEMRSDTLGKVNPLNFLP